MAAISMSRRTIALVVAVVLAGVATIALVSYIQGVEDEALGEGELVQVFVAKGAIARGTSAETINQRALIERKSVPRQFVPQGAVSTFTAIQGKVATTNISPGEELLTSRFALPGQARLEGGGLLNIPRNRVAVAVDVGVVPAVAGFIQQGDRVSAIAELTVPSRGRAGNEKRVQFLLQNIEVLAVGKRVVITDEESGRTRESTQQKGDQFILTLALNPGQAERIVFAKLNGTLWFTLLPPGARPVQTRGRTARNTFPGGAP